MVHPILADAEVAKSTGGMIAIYPSQDSLDELVIPGGEPREDMHITLCYLGEDVSGLTSSYAAQNLAEDIAMWLNPLVCRVFAHATFNPDNHEGRESCAVYLVGDSDELPVLYADLQAGIGALYEIPRQHTPWCPHITAGYGKTAADLTFTGEIVLDRIALKWAGESFDYSL